MSLIINPNPTIMNIVEPIFQIDLNNSVIVKIVRKEFCLLFYKRTVSKNTERSILPLIPNKLTLMEQLT